MLISVAVLLEFPISLSRLNTGTGIKVYLPTFFSVFDQTRSFVFDIFSESKLNLRRKRRDQVIKICAD